MDKNFQNSGVNLRNIKFLAERRRMSLTDLADKIGITYVGLSKIIRENTTTLTTLQKIADALGYPIQVFFLAEDQLLGLSDFSIEKYNKLKKENEELKAEISELKNKIIRLADRF